MPENQKIKNLNGVKDDFKNLRRNGITINVKKKTGYLRAACKKNLSDNP